MVDGWYWFVLPAIIPLSIVAGLLATRLRATDVLPAAALHAPIGGVLGGYRLRSQLPRFGISMFVGVTIVGAVLGSLCPPLNRVAGPLVCGDRTLDLRTSEWTAPGEVRITFHWACVDEATGAREEVEGVTVPFTAGAVHGLFVFLGWNIGAAWWRWARRKALARVRPAEVTIASRTDGKETDDPRTYVLRVSAANGEPYRLSVDKRWYEMLVDRNGKEKSWDDFGVGDSFRAEYDPRRPKRLYVVGFGTS